jgi:hypothetical protein
MSAFVVDPSHIDVLLSTAIHGPADRDRAQPWHAPWVGDVVAHQGPLTPELADCVGAALLRLNIASVCTSCGCRELRLSPGATFIPDPRQYEWTDLGPILTIVEAMKAIETYEYHSGSTFRWQGSGQEAFCNRLRGSLARCLAGYDAAESHWTADVALARAPRRGNPEVM